MTSAKAVRGATEASGAAETPRVDDRPERRRLYD